jgi:hypothetical protein
MEALLRDIYNSAKNDPELQSTLQIEAMLNRHANEYDDSDISMVAHEHRGPTLAVYQRETQDRLESLVPHFSVVQIPATVRALQEYRFIDNVDELRIGRFTRWISHAPPNPLYLHQYKPPKLNNGGILYHIHIGDLGVYLHIHCFFTHRTLKYKFDNMWTFQKFNGPELAVLAARTQA